MINDEMISQMSHYNSLKSRILFEISSWIGRKFCRNRSKIPLTKEPLLLDLGVGDNYKDDWIHADFFSCPRHFNPLKILFSRKDKTKRLPEVETDLRYPLNCPDDSIDGVYFSHTIEHLLPHEAINLIREIYRVLKPNKWLRIIVPDLKFSVESYYGRNKLSKFTGCEAIMSYTQNWGHRSAWDEELLSLVLKNAGFINIKKVDYGTGGQDARLIKEEDIRQLGSLVLEAQKPDY